MAWLIAIVCIILVVSFWRIFLPLALIAALLAGGLFIWVDQDQKAQVRQITQERQERN